MELNYQIALTNVPFDNSYKNVLRFDTRSEQEAYFQTNTLFSNSPDVNFNVGSLYATNVVYDGNENENINELLNKNYCIVKDKRENATIKYYYYFVTNAKQDCDNRILLALELDIFQTYYIDILFSDSVIYKAHLNRFVDNGDGTVSFDGTPTSKLFEREDIQNVAKRMTKRTQIDIYNTGYEDLDEWLNKWVLCWEYIYLDPTHDFTIYGITTGGEDQRKIAPISYSYFEGGSGQIESQISCICVPIFKTKPNYFPTIRFQQLDGTGTTIIDFNGLDYFLEHNNGNSYVYAIKLSYTPPFNQYDTRYEISNQGENYPILTFKGYIEDLASIMYTNLGVSMLRTSSTNDNENISYGVLRLNSQGNKNLLLKSKNYTVSKDLTFNKNDIINSNKNVKYNPKLLASDYFNLRLSDQTENGFDYDYQKLNQKTLNIQSIEALTPDMSKRYISFLSQGGIYIPENSQNLVGFINNNDATLILATDAYKSMLANNKNFFLQNALNREIDYAKGLVGGTMSIMNQAMSGNFLGAFSTAITSGVNLGLDYQKSKITEQLTVDNLKNAPASIQSAKGNVVFELMYSPNGIIVEEWDIIDNEKEMINDYMCLYGFTYNRVDNVKNVDNIRKIYNFVRADIETINSSNFSISETVRKKFRECFANGVRFWNIDTFAYNKENYERWLENE